MNKQSLNLINSLIQKTNSNSIHWSTIESRRIYPKPKKEETLLDRSTSVSINTVVQQSYSHSHSYVITHNDGSIFLISYNDILRSISPQISLVVQTESSKYSVEYANTDTSDEEVATYLKRLYNLVDSTDNNILSFVIDFINHQ